MDSSTRAEPQRQVEPRQRDDVLVSEISDLAPSYLKLLNPFAFPSETNQRFILFASGAVMWVLNWGIIISVRLAEFVPGSNGVVDAPLWSALLALAILFTAAALYLTHPRRIMRKQKLEPLAPGQDTQVETSVERLTELAELDAVPRVMLRKGAQVGGQAFGLRNRYRVRLDDGMRLALRKSPATFRAIFLHELAHIANGDIGRTYFSQGLWSATFWLAIVPYIAALLIADLAGGRFVDLMNGSWSNAQWVRLFTRSIPQLLAVLAQLAASAGIAYLIYASLLRAREVEADWRVAQWGTGAPLADLLARAAANTARDGKRMRAWLRDKLALHPSADERLRLLQHPEHLFRLSLDVPLFVGWLTMTILVGMITLYIVYYRLFEVVTQSLTAFGNQSAVQAATDPVFLALQILSYLLLALTFLAFVAPITVLGFPVMGTLGLQVLRASTADQYFGRRGFRQYVRLLAPAAAMAAGLYLGVATSPLSYAFLGPTAASMLFAAFPFVAGAMWTCLAALRFLGQSLLGAKAGTQPPQGRVLFLLAAFGGFVTLILLLFAVWQLLGLSVEQKNPFVATANAAAAEFLRNQLAPLAWTTVAVFLAAFFTSWGLAAVWRRVRPPRCPQCGAVAAQGHVLGRQCHACKAELAPWLLLAYGEKSGEINL